MGVGCDAGPNDGKVRQNAATREKTFCYPPRHPGRCLWPSCCWLGSGKHDKMALGAVVPGTAGGGGSSMRGGWLCTVGEGGSVGENLALLLFVRKQHEKMVLQNS